MPSVDHVEFITECRGVHTLATPKGENGRYIVTGAHPHRRPRALQANEGEELMGTITTPRMTATTGLPTCPWWCTAGPDGDAWQLDRQGAWTRTHLRQVGGFTMSATERVTGNGESRIEMHPTHADFVLLDGANRASELSEDLHQVAAILRLIESGQGE